MEHQSMMLTQNHITAKKKRNVRLKSQGGDRMMKRVILLTLGFLLEERRMFEGLMSL